MKVDSCRHCFDYSLSNKCLEHIYCGSEEERSAFLWTQFHKTAKHHQNRPLSRSIVRRHPARTLSNSSRTLSLAPRKIWLVSSFSPPLVRHDQGDCSPPGLQIPLHVKQLFPGLYIPQTIEIKSGFCFETHDIYLLRILPSYAPFLCGMKKAKPLSDTHTNSS